jgi:copper homeostasis protein
MTSVLVEVCVDSIEGAVAAEGAGAGRVELCVGLVEGGTTPAAGMIEECVARVGIPVFVMVRPRGGDFVVSDGEFAVMRREVAWARRLGAAGVVLGILDPDGAVDVERTRILVEEARPLAVTFHRAFDVCRDPAAALDVLVGLGVERVLTSGQAATAEAGIPLLRRLVERAAGRIGIVAGGGVRAANVRRIIAETGVAEVHLRAATTRPGAMRFHHPGVRFGGGTAPQDDVRMVTDAEEVAAVRGIVNCEW